MFSVKELVRQGYSMESIIELKAQYDKDQEELAIYNAREAKRIAASKEASVKYFADKEANGAKCITCGCTLAVSTTSGYCRKHVAKATLTKAPSERAPKQKYVTKTFYGVKGNDLMDHSYYQGGSVSPR